MKLLDVTFYKNFHLDLKSMDLTNKELIHQYKEYGSMEGRIASEVEFYELYTDFDLDFYNSFYPDLSIFNGDKYLLMWHYHNLGFKEGRICTNFDPIFYNNFHLDIKCLGLNEKQLKESYKNYGKKECRLCCETDFYALYPEFDLNFYNSYYADLSILNENKYLVFSHFHNHGFKEGRLQNSEDFDPIFYNNFYLDIKYLELNPQQLRESYENYGKKESRLCNEYLFYKKYPSFNLNFYLFYYSDLDVFNGDKYLLMWHYDNWGFKENRKMNIEKINIEYTKINIEDTKINIKDTKINIEDTKINNYKNYPFLFGKYLLGLNEPESPIPYEIIKENVTTEFIQNKRKAHLHCFNIEKFNYFYNSYLDKISKYCSIIITYVCGDSSNFSHNNYTLIKIRNKGMDIGGKFVCVNYLKDKNIDYENILFLHSKTDDNLRCIFFDSLINNIDYIYNKLEKNIGGFLPPWIFNGDNNDIIIGDDLNHKFSFKSKIDRNYKYLNEISDFLGLDNNFSIFPAGNCYVLNKDIIESIFLKKELYNILNDETSCDLFWVTKYYSNLFHENEKIDKIYKKIVENKLIPNNLSCINNKLSDCMIEHIFERIIIKIIKKKGFNIEILCLSQNSYNSCKLITEIINCYLNNIINEEICINALINNNINVLLLQNINGYNNLINIKNSCLWNISSYEKNNKKNIFHISHNFGGGTDTYISNIINTYDKYNHILIKIVGASHVKVNNLIFDIEILNNLLDNCNSTVFVHHLLYDCCGTTINKNILNILISNKTINKLLIIHDYYLLLPEFPNPIKKHNIIPSKENIEFTSNTINKFNKVIFNSNSCYCNYKKYINPIENYIILNNVPDMDYYNFRCFPKNKNIFNIGIIGDVSNHEHKGKFLLEKILSSFQNNNKYNFIVFGIENEIPSFNYSNLYCTGHYNNDIILSLINEKDIDYFLFLSTFEETYSFTLSIALKFGVPIIYNNIGSYPERLSQYNNCFPFTEDNYIEIHTILDNIENNFINDNNVKPSVNNNNMILYKNIPELSEYLRHDDELNFDLSNIESNLINKNVCFIAFSNIDNSDPTYKNILYDQINYIKSSGLYDKLDYIFITMLGEYTNIINDYKIKVIYYSPDIYEWEFPNYKRIKYFCDNISFNVNILEIHIKGAQKKPHAYEWRKYLEYFLISKYDLCIHLLHYYKCVGVNQQFYFDEGNKYRNHFSGNFWWSRSDHIKNLPLIETNVDRCVVEHWLIGNFYKNDYRNFISLHHTDYDLYQTSILPEEYSLEIIKNNTLKKLNESFIKTRPIYGVYFICCIGNYYDILQNQINKLIESGLYNQTTQILCFVCNQRKECLDLLAKYSKLKVISTTENLYEKFAINNYKKYLQGNGNYYLFYIHTKGVSKSGKCFDDWTAFCDYFTIYKWRVSIELLKYYDCVGTNLKNFPKKHYSGNYWWSKSEHLNKLKNINDGYISCEMYILSYLKTNYVSLYQTYINHGDTEYPEKLYKNKSELELFYNLVIVPDFNDGDKKCISMCGEIDLNCEPPILELE
jgi:hypothetical protein